MGTQSSPSRLNRPDFLSLFSVCRVGVAAWILAYYLLPNTMWATISPASLLVRQIDTYHNSATLFILPVIVGAAVYLLAQSTAYRAKNFVPIWILVAAYLGAGLYTAFTCRDNWILFRDIAELLTAVAVGLICGALCGSTFLTFVLLCGLCTVQAVFALWYHHQGINDLVSGVVNRAGGTFNQPDGLYTLMIVALPISLAQALSSRTIKLRELFTLSSPVLFAALLMTWDRGGVLGAMVGVAWIVWKRINSKLPAIFALVVLASIVVFVGQARVHGSINSSSSSRSIEGREEFWVGGARLFGRYPLTGVGVGELSLSIPLHNQVAGSPSTASSYEPKSVFLLWLDELGIGGGILFCLMVVGIFYTIRGSASDDLSVAVGAAWIALFVASLFDTTFATAERPYGDALWGCLLIGTAMLAPIGVNLPDENKAEAPDLFVPQLTE